MRNLSIEMKIILGAIFFTFLIVGLERYQLSENIVNQFIESKKSKNRLLADTISPIISLNLSLGLQDANIEYLNLIVSQNSDLKYIIIKDKKNKTLFQYPTETSKLSSKSKNDMNNCSRPLVDTITKKVIGHIYLEFNDTEYNLIISKNKEITLKIFLVTFILLTIYTLLIKQEFRHLRNLTKNVLAYDPKRNNFTLKRSKQRDEAGVIHNAIVSMVNKINSYANMLDELNASLEEKIKQRTKELEEANKKLEKLSTTDPLTEISNRRHFDKHIQNIWDLTMRSQTVTSVVMCDIDYFKRINDTYGHTIGDEVLKNVADTIRGSLKRNSDLVARYGGEEFIIVLYDTDLEGASRLCEDIAELLRDEKNFQIEDIQINPFTISFGVCSVVPNKEYKYEDLIKAADEALYEAKEQGRNRIVARELEV